DAGDVPVRSGARSADHRNPLSADQHDREVLSRGNCSRSDQYHHRSIVGGIGQRIVEVTNLEDVLEVWTRQPRDQKERRAEYFVDDSLVGFVVIESGIAAHVDDEPLCSCRLGERYAKRFDGAGDLGGHVQEEGLRSTVVGEWAAQAQTGRRAQTKKRFKGIGMDELGASFAVRIHHVKGPRSVHRDVLARGQVETVAVGCTSGALILAGVPLFDRFSVDGNKHVAGVHFVGRRADYHRAAVKRLNHHWEIAGWGWPSVIVNKIVAVVDDLAES